MSLHLYGSSFFRLFSSSIRLFSSSSAILRASSSARNLASSSERILSSLFAGFSPTATMFFAVSLLPPVFVMRSFQFPSRVSGKVTFTARTVIFPRTVSPVFSSKSSTTDSSETLSASTFRVKLLPSSRNVGSVSLSMNFGCRSSSFGSGSMNFSTITISFSGSGFCFCSASVFSAVSFC